MFQMPKYCLSTIAEGPIQITTFHVNHRFNFQLLSGVVLPPPHTLFEVQVKVPRMSLPLEKLYLPFRRRRSKKELTGLFSVKEKENTLPTWQSGLKARMLGCGAFPAAPLPLSLFFFSFCKSPLPLQFKVQLSGVLLRGLSTGREKNLKNPSNPQGRGCEDASLVFLFAQPE